MSNLEEYNQKTAIVTGAMGFVGRNVVEGLLDQSIGQVIAVDDCSNSSPEMPEHWEDRVVLLKQSVTSEKWLRYIKSSSHVFHLACKTLLECDENPGYDAEVNATSTLRILEEARHLGDKAPAFVYASSASVYGNTPDFAIDESYPTIPLSQYGVSKLTGESYTRMYAEKYGLRTTALRLSNVYGPWQTPNNPYCGVIGIFFDQAIKGEPLGVIGDGRQSRDFSYAGDVVEAILKAGSNPKAKGEVLNVSAGVAVSIGELALEVQKLFPDVEIGQQPPRLIDNIQHRLLDNSRIGEVLDWQSHTTLGTGLRETLKWVRANQASVDG